MTAVLRFQTPPVRNGSGKQVCGKESSDVRTIEAPGPSRQSGVGAAAGSKLPIISAAPLSFGYDWAASHISMIHLWLLLASLAVHPGVLRATEAAAATSGRVVLATAIQAVVAQQAALMTCISSSLASL